MTYLWDHNLSPELRSGPIHVSCEACGREIYPSDECSCLRVKPVQAKAGNRYLVTLNLLAILSLAGLYLLSYFEVSR